jgi:enamine deaminase RidA (YjgF/YER057c/UK114 family)
VARPAAGRPPPGAGTLAEPSARAPTTNPRPSGSPPAPEQPPEAAGTARPYDRVVPDDRPAFASPDDLPAPAGYSHVVTIPAGRLVWTSGQVGLDADGRPGDGWEEQTRLAFANVGRALAAAGAGWGDVVKLTYFVVATDALETVRAVRDEFVDTAAPPTSSLVQVAGLFRSDLLVEVETVAAIAG